MHCMKYFGVIAILASMGLAVPNPPKPPKPTEPAKPTATVVNQSNICGNNNTPYCCSTDKEGKTTCTAMGAGSSQCGTTIVCCNAANVGLPSLKLFDI
ncbi:hypothetical protein LTR14_011705 [Exophiala xenobiotica]|nr:hypothetical protein LTR14_011705 [Exophiala xenobiotica]